MKTPQNPEWQNPKRFSDYVPVL